MLTISLGLDLLEAIHVLVKFGRIFKILDLDGDMNNACHKVPPFNELYLTEHIFALRRAPCLRLIWRVTPVGTTFLALSRRASATGQCPLLTQSGHSIDSS